MKAIESGKDKVKKICDVLRKETLEPALLEAEQIVQSAKQEAERLISQTMAQIEQLKQEAALEIAREKNVFEASLSQACKQALSFLKQDIENKILDQQLLSLLSRALQEPRTLSNLITALIQAIDKEGMDVSLSAYIPAAIPARAVNELLGAALLERLKEKSVLIGSMAGGIALVLHQNKMTIDLSDKALKDLVAGYIRKDFRDMIFGG